MEREQGIKKPRLTEGSESPPTRQMRGRITPRLRTPPHSRDRAAGASTHATTVGVATACKARGGIETNGRPITPPSRRWGGAWSSAGLGEWSGRSSCPVASAGGGRRRLGDRRCDPATDRQRRVARVLQGALGRALQSRRRENGREGEQGEELASQSQGNVGGPPQAGTCPPRRGDRG